MISIKAYKEILINSNESLERALRILPHMIQEEVDNPRPKSPKVIRDLQKRLNAAREIYVIRKLQGAL